jgi:uncharacterized membrane protein
MRTLGEFIKTTLIGGVLVILPIYIAVLLLAKMVMGLLGLLKPLTEHIPAGVEFRQIIAILLLPAFCFLVGLVVRTGPGLRVKNAFERAVLQKLPGYTFLRGLAGRLTGRSEGHALQPALVEIEDALVPALIVEELDDGSYTVLVPSAPTPMAGSIYILARDGGPSGRHPVHQGNRRILEMGYRGRRVRARDEERRRSATGRALAPPGQVLTAGSDAEAVLIDNMSPAQLRGGGGPLRGPHSCRGVRQHHARQPGRDRRRRRRHRLVRLAHPQRAHP